jgi:hypothetical protein
MTAKRKSISFGTSCMGRIEHLEQTYIKNIETALDQDPDTKFVLLNYNSQDGMDKWVKSCLIKYIKKGIVKYLRNTTATEFSQSRTKNITLKHGLHEIVCNLDADNVITTRYMKKIIKVWNDPTCRIGGSGGIVTEDDLVISCPLPHVWGRLSMYKKTLITLGGFDEQMRGWGGEDIDFMNRHKATYKRGLRYMYHQGSHEIKKRDVFVDIFGHPPPGKSTNREENRNGINKTLSKSNMEKGILVANAGKQWGAVKD